MYFVSIGPDNIDKHGLFCSKNPKLVGFQDKKRWYIEQYQHGLRIHIAKNKVGQDTGFIEFIPVENAWRPVQGKNLLFIHCIMVNKTKFKGQGIANFLIQTCEDYAKNKNMDGVCVMTSNGTWLASKDIYVKRNFTQLDQKGRFELMLKAFTDHALVPKILDWELMLKNLEGWHLIYSNQCPFLYKSVKDVKDECDERGIDLQITQIKSSKEAKLAPSGYGVFTLVRDGRILQDHYASKTRFKNILKIELSN